MQTRMARWLGALFVLLSIGAAATAQSVEVAYFYEVGCPHCGRVADALAELEAQHESLTVHRYDIHSEEGRALLPRLLAAYEAQLGPVPMVFAGDVAMVGGTFYGIAEDPVSLSGIAEVLRVRSVVEEAVAQGAKSPFSRIPTTATEMVVFLPEDCSDCEQFKTLVDSLLEQHPLLGVRRLSLADPANERTFDRLRRLANVRGDAPALFVGDLSLVGGIVYVRREPARPFAYTDEDRSYVGGVVARAVESGATSPLDRLRLREQLTLWAVVGAAALDSVNPCDFAVLVLLLGTLLVIGRRGKVIWAGLAFSAGIFISYYLLGFLLYSVLGITVGSRGFREPFIYAVSALAIIVGLWEMKDLLWYGRWFTIEVPDRWKPKVKRLTASVVTVPGAFLVGVMDSLFLAPCTSGPYLAILSLLSQTTERFQGAMLLLLYNFIFILPMVAITLAVHFGLTTTARAERWRSARLGKLHFVTGVMMVLLGAGMIVGVRLGYL